nr:hypothetical protein [Tanacetum cinerariifolium]
MRGFGEIGHGFNPSSWLKVTRIGPHCMELGLKNSFRAARVIKKTLTWFKELLSCRKGNQEDIDLVKERYKVAKREGKIAVANAKDKAYKDLYKKLDSKERANDIYKIAKARERRRRDIGNVRYIKDERSRTIVREEDIRKRWGEYFSSLFNENPSDESRADVGTAVGSSSPHMHYECYYSMINQGEVKTALKKMGRNKAVGPDQIPIEAWRSLEDEGNKGDAQACSNYRGIKLLSHTMKLWERVIERRLRKETKVSENQFGFMPGRVGERTKQQTLELEEDTRRQWLTGRIDDHVAHRIRAGWTKVLADHESPSDLEVAELRMLRWICGKTMIDMIPNGVFRAKLDVDSIVDKMREGRLRWFGHVKRRPRNAPVRRVEAMEVEGSRQRGRPKLRWEDRLKMDMKEFLLSEDMTSDRNAWRDRIRISG